MAVSIYEFKEGKIRLRTSVARLGNILNVYKYCMFALDRRLILATRNCSVSVYDENGQKEFSRARPKSNILGGGIIAFAVSPSGREIVVANEGLKTSVRVLSLPDLHEVARLSVQKTSPFGYITNREQISAVQISGDGRQVALGTKDGDIRIFDLQDCQEVALLQPSRSLRRKINNLDFSPDGKLVASASNDGTARVWTIKPLS